MLSWLLQTIRLTAFRTNPVNEVVPLWEKLIGQKPISIDSQPRNNIIVEEGSIDLGNLVHTSNPLRIDWVLVPLLEQQQKEVIPQVGIFDKVKPQFIQLMSKWLESAESPQIKRLALSPVLILPVGTKESAYKQLASLLPAVKIDVENSSDLFYQINRPIKSKIIPELKINRLSKWNAMRILGMGVLFGASPQVVRQPDTNQNYLRLELDINTEECSTTLPKMCIVEILRELDNICVQIASEGDWG